MACICLPKGSNAVGVLVDFLLRDYFDVLPKTELHWSLWVVLEVHVGLRFHGELWLLKIQAILKSNNFHSRSIFHASGAASTSHMSAMGSIPMRRAAAELRSKGVENPRTSTPKRGDKLPAEVGPRASRYLINKEVGYKDHMDYGKWVLCEVFGPSGEA